MAPKGNGSAPGFTACPYQTPTVPPRMTMLSRSSCVSCGTTVAGLGEVARRPLSVELSRLERCRARQEVGGVGFSVPRRLPRLPECWSA